MAFLAGLLPTLVSLVGSKIGGAASTASVDAAYAIADARQNAQLIKSLQHGSDLNKRQDEFSQAILVRAEEEHEDHTLENLAVTIDGATHKIVEKIASQIS